MNITALVSALQALTSDVEKKKLIFGGLLSIQDIRQNFNFVPNMKKGMLRPIFALTASSRPFTTTFTGTDTQSVSAKKLELYKGKIEQKVTPSDYEDWFETLGLINGFDWRDTDALAKFIIDTIIEVEGYDIRTNVLYNGILNGAGTSTLDTMNGFGKLIADAVTGGTIPAQQVEATGAMTQANTYDNIRKVVDRVGENYVGQRDMQVLTSRQLLAWWIDGYKANHNGAEPEYIYEPVLTDGVGKEGADSLRLGNKRIAGVYMDGIHSGVPLKIESSMTGKQRVIATPKSNMQIGTNMEDFGAYLFDILRQHYTFDVFARYDMACGIYEFGNKAIAVNDVA